jgi:hypothetical protein
MNIYLAVDNDLVIKSPSGAELWRGRPEGHVVAWATSVPDSDDGLVLYDPYPSGWQTMSGFQNLVRISLNGGIVWRAALPARGSKYVSAKLATGGLKAFAPSYDVDINLDTGKVVRQVWTK